MGVYTQFKDGYAREAIWGTSTITAAGDTAYLFGAISQKSKFPSVTSSVISQAPDVGYREPPDNAIYKRRFDVRGFFGLRMQNGILLQLAMGKSTTAGTDPYTHTISAVTDGSALPSLTLQHERSGTATDWAKQATGCMIDRLSLVHDARDADFLMARADVLGKQLADPGFMLTNDPALPATASTSTYHALTRTWDYGVGNTSLDGLVRVQIDINNGLAASFAHTWDSGTYVGNWASAIVEAFTKQYTITLSLHPSTVEDDMWDEGIASSNTKTLLLKWTRSTNDYIQIQALDCQVQYGSDIPRVEDELLDDITIIPRSLAIEVKDSIAGGAYGE